MGRARTNAAPRQTGRVARRVSIAEQRKALLHASVAGPIKALDLDRRIPEFCRKRGWPPDPAALQLAQKAGLSASQVTGYEWLGGVVGAYKLKLINQTFTIPKAFQAHERWAALVQEFGPRPTCAVICEAMELDELLTQEAGHYEQ